jgi:hypothetical protein
MSWSIEKDLKALEDRLCLDREFLNNLHDNESDWSFVIKLSALVEAACTHTIAVLIGYLGLEENLAYLDQSNSKVGRIKLLKEMEVIFPNQAKILSALATLRNQIAHNVKNVDFDFQKHLKCMDKNQVDSFVINFGNSINDEVDMGDRKISRKNFVLALPKYAVLVSTSEVLACMNLHLRESVGSNRLGQ